MQILNLIRPEKSEVKYEIIQFPDGEPHITLYDIDRKDNLNIVCRICNPTDLFILMQVGDILNRQGVSFNLDIIYLMGMRMDRVMSYDEPYSLSIVSYVINSMFPQSVHVLEPHSNKVENLINRCWGNVQTPLLNFAEYLRVYPDKGAVQRYGGCTSTEIFCNKVRDAKTGKLSGFRIENPEVLKESNKPLAVIDDLCDGGGTFAGVAKELRKAAPNRKLCIHVTHMVNPKGITTLSENYDEVSFTNSYKDWDNEALPSNVRVIRVV